MLYVPRQFMLVYHTGKLFALNFSYGKGRLNLGKGGKGRLDLGMEG